MNWYCIINGTQRGPMPLAELQTLIRNGVASAEDYVWNEAFGEQWRRVREVPELTSPAVAVPPPELQDAPPPTATTPLTGVPGQCPSFMTAMQQAWDRTIQLLFRNTSMARWLGMAFCVWISIIGLQEPNLIAEGLLRQIQPDPVTLKSRAEACTTPDQIIALYSDLLTQMTDKARELLTPTMIQTALIVWIVLFVLTGWLRARGAFMLMHRWQHPDASVAQSWASGCGLGRSLFLFRLVFSVAMTLITGVLLGVIYQRVFEPLQHGTPLEGALANHAFLLVLGLSLVLTLWTSVVLLVNHFVVPIMYWRRVGVLDAWRVVLDLCNERPGALTIYFTLYIILLHVLLAALTVVACCTCCCLCYLSILPFLNAILLLPIALFLRGLSVNFLRQWRPDLESEKV